MDYLSFFNLRSEPFSHAPLSRLYYASSQHTRALRRLLYAVSTMRGLALLVGDIGRGKTTLARRLLDLLPEEEYEAAMLVIVHAGITPTWLLRRLALQLGVPDPANDKLDVLSQLYQRLIEIHRSGRRAVVLIDEAQMLASRELMEEFRGLLNLEVPGKKLITFVFFGLPEIEQNLQLDPPLAQRVALRCHLEPLGLEDTHAYVRHRLRLSGGAADIFSEDALAAIRGATGGIPRVINTLCDNVLLELYFAKRRRADAELVREVAEGLGLAMMPVQAAPAAQPEAEAGPVPVEPVVPVAPVAPVEPVEPVEPVVRNDFKSSVRDVAASGEGSRLRAVRTGPGVGEPPMWGRQEPLPPDAADLIAAAGTGESFAIDVDVDGHSEKHSDSSGDTTGNSSIDGSIHSYIGGSIANTITDTTDGVVAASPQALGVAAAALVGGSEQQARRVQAAAGSPVGHGEPSAASRLSREVRGPLAALFRDALEASYGLTGVGADASASAPGSDGMRQTPPAPAPAFAPAPVHAASSSVVTPTATPGKRGEAAASCESGAATLDLAADDGLLANISRL